MIDILRARQNLVMMESKFPQDTVETFEKIENYGNPWGLSPQDRENWMEGSNVPLMQKKNLRKSCIGQVAVVHMILEEEKYLSRWPI